MINWLKKHKGMIGNILYLVGFIYFVNKGLGFHYFIGSGLVFGIIFHKQLWFVMKKGGELYEQFSRKQGSKLYEKYEKIKKK